MALTMQSDAHATVSVNQLHASASTEKLVLTLAPRRGLSDDKDALSRPASIQWLPIFSERKEAQPHDSGVYSQTDAPPESPPSAGEREAPARVLRCNLRLNIIRATVITTWCFSNIALLLSNR